jgi:hypothetical protein
MAAADAAIGAVADAAAASDAAAAHAPPLVPLTSNSTYTCGRTLAEWLERRNRHDKRPAKQQRSDQFADPSELVGGWAFPFMIATREVVEGDDLRYSYGKVRGRGKGWPGHSQLPVGYDPWAGSWLRQALCQLVRGSGCQETAFDLPFPLVCAGVF